MASDTLTHRRVLNISIPIVLSNITVPILGLVDTGVIGQMGEAAPIGAVGLGAAILTGIYWIFGFLRMGTTGLAAQAIGAKDDAEVAALLTRVLMIGGVGGLVVIALQTVLFAGAFSISPASTEVETLAQDYMAIRVWSAPAMIATYGLTGWLIAQERTRAVLGIQLVMNGVNILLDFWFVLGLDWGVSGVAFATFVAEWSGLLLGLWLCRKAFDLPDWRNWHQVFDGTKLWHMATVNGDILVRSVLLTSIFMSFTFFASGLGDVPLAANQVLLQFLQLTAFAMDGFAFGAEALVGQAMGAKARSELRKAAYMTSQWGLGICVCFAVSIALFGGAGIDLLTTAEDVRAEARVYLPYMVVAPLLGCAAWMLDGIFIGATRTADMRNMMIVSAVIYFSCVYPLIWAFGNHGLWLALLISFVARGATLWLRYPKLEAAV